MLTCTFLSHHKPLDLDLPERLGQAIEEVLSCGSDFEFWFHQNKVVEDLALKILQEEKKRRPDHRITLTLVGSHDDSPENGLVPKPYDKFLCPLPPSDSYFIYQINQLVRWRLNHADFLISYVYELLRDERHMLRYARSREGLTILDLTSQDTLRELVEQIPELSNARDSAILDAYARGESNEALARRYGVSKENIRRLHARGSWKLQERHRRRLLKRLKEEAQE